MYDYKKANLQRFGGREEVLLYFTLHYITLLLHFIYVGFLMLSLLVTLSLSLKIYNNVINNFRNIVYNNFSV